MDTHRVRSFLGSLVTAVTIVAAPLSGGLVDPTAAGQVYTRRAPDGTVHFSSAPTAPGFHSSDSVSQPVTRIVTESAPKAGEDQLPAKAPAGDETAAGATDGEAQ
jgi:hypothetical protein